MAVQVARAELRFEPTGLDLSLAVTSHRGQTSPQGPSRGLRLSV